MLIPQALTKARPYQSVVYPGVSRSCFMLHCRYSPASPALDRAIVAAPKHSATHKA